MYKVFFNDREISISHKNDITLTKSQKTIESLHTVYEVKNWFLSFVSQEVKSITLISASPEDFWENVFIPSFITVKAAGGVILRNKYLLFIYRKEKWDLPKGKIDKGETPEEAAIREVREECCIFGHSIVKKLPSTFHIYQSPYKKSKGEWILKETIWFEMEYSGIENGNPQIEENISKIRWFEKGELSEVLKNTYENLRQIIMLYLD